MADKDAFLKTIKDGYTFKGEAVKIGAGMLDGEVVTGADVFTSFKNNEPAWIDCWCYRYR